MRRPKTPPDPPKLDRKQSAKLFASIYPYFPLIEDRNYFHWDQIAHRKPPGSLSREEWWIALKWLRHQKYIQLPLNGCDGNPFVYARDAGNIPEALHNFDFVAGGRIQMPEQITNPETKDQYYMHSLIEEAITSSQLEGAVATRRVAKEMIRTGRAPRDRSERMILNNFLTMQRIGQLKAEPLTVDLVLELQGLVTGNALDDASAAGRLRTADEQIVVSDVDGTVFHHPPPASELPERLERMCAFANGELPTGFLHPVIRSIILHFWLAYDHPFLDGNGRTARALFYWSMLHQEYWLFEFISISSIILKARVRYFTAFLFTETDENDLTYFILYHLEVIERAILELHGYIKRRTRQIQSLEANLKGFNVLNHRQRALLAHAVRHPAQRYTIASHRKSHNVAYQTARDDLLDLRDRGLLEGRKIGKTWHFTPVEDMEARLGVLT